MLIMCQESTMVVHDTPMVVHDTPQVLTLSMLNLYISCFENSVDLDQKASQKPAD